MYETTDLIPAPREDRVRLAIEELIMLAESGHWTPLAQGEIILKHAECVDEVLELGDIINAKLRRRRQIR